MRLTVQTVNNRTRPLLTATLVFISVTASAKAQGASWESEVRQRSADLEQKLITWRRDIHQHPELGDQEKRTAGIVAEHLKSLGLKVRTNVARTGVVAVLEGPKAGRTVALRADMDALAVKEMTGLPFASTATAQYRGAQVPVMHACGHDTHTAMLMATAEVLTGLRSQIAGTIIFIFQPAEEGSSIVEPGSGSWGAKLGPCFWNSTICS